MCVLACCVVIPLFCPGQCQPSILRHFFLLLGLAIFCLLLTFKGRPVHVLCMADAPNCTCSLLLGAVDISMPSPSVVILY